MAMGIVMERFTITDDRAFDLLRRLSQGMNRKLVDIARDIVATGQLPVSPVPRRRSGD
ncbi:hypothetical protein DQ244_04240 [Blastococcus sp. TBT05-19]|nr:hypothetical protein DQ244_04240 [Blastococcus sp. TBT05-19]